MAIKSSKVESLPADLREEADKLISNRFPEERKHDGYEGTVTYQAVHESMIDETKLAFNRALDMQRMNMTPPMYTAVDWAFNEDKRVNYTPVRTARERYILELRLVGVRSFNDYTVCVTILEGGNEDDFILKTIKDWEQMYNEPMRIDSVKRY